MQIDSIQKMEKLFVEICMNPRASLLIYNFRLNTKEIYPHGKLPTLKLKDFQFIFSGYISITLIPALEA